MQVDHKAPPACGCDALVAALERLESKLQYLDAPGALADLRAALAAHAQQPAPVPAIICRVCGGAWDGPPGKVYCASHHGLCGMCSKPRATCKCLQSSTEDMGRAPTAPPACGCDALVEALEAIAQHERSPNTLSAREIASRALVAHRSRPVAQASEPPCDVCGSDALGTRPICRACEVTPTDLADMLDARPVAPAVADGYRERVAAFAAAWDAFACSVDDDRIAEHDAVIEARRDLLADHPEADAAHKESESCAAREELAWRRKYAFPPTAPAEPECKRCHGDGYPSCQCVADDAEPEAATVASELPGGWSACVVCEPTTRCLVYGKTACTSDEGCVVYEDHNGRWPWSSTGETEDRGGIAPTMLQAMCAALGIVFESDGSGNTGHPMLLAGSGHMWWYPDREECARDVLDRYHAQHSKSAAEPASVTPWCTCGYELTCAYCRESAASEPRGPRAAYEPVDPEIIADIGDSAALIAEIRERHGLPIESRAHGPLDPERVHEIADAIAERDAARGLR